jgi:catechol 2,3-dioxygenase-like lactoylglutathione lyase family enzyme
MHIPKVKRVAHVVLYVRNPEASAKWYGEVLGMKVSARVPDGPYDPDGHQLEVFCQQVPFRRGARRSRSWGWRYPPAGE